jgi:Glycosyl hydrolases family 2, sugar binding domain
MDHVSTTSLSPRRPSALLSGQWHFCAEPGTSWQPVDVPNCWEAYGCPHNWQGVGIYRKQVAIPSDFSMSEPIFVRFQAVSCRAQVFANGVLLGEHTGAWDAFELRVPAEIAEAGTFELTVRVIKPGGDALPTNQTTAGFLPYVWGYLHGGIWQDVWLVNGPTPPPEPAAAPRITVDGDTPFLDGKPYYPRMALSWGWYPDLLHCNPPEERIRQELQHLAALGFNGVKCCLWIPTERYLEICEEFGFTVWMELPLWLPEIAAEGWVAIAAKYERIVLQLRKHRCITIWTLGCELSTSCPESFLRSMYQRVKELTGSALVRDNSGGGECYGGLLKENADYYDYHLYCDLEFIRGSFDYFVPRWRSPQPWFFGEFCDADACRDLPAVREANGGEFPWWFSRNQQVNPQGARWDMNILGVWDNVQKYGLEARLPELIAGQRLQTLLHRKFTIETVRSYREMSGYVVTGLYDTPISTAGMLDDFGNPRYRPEEFLGFNSDTVLFLGWHRRRSWDAGGDRPSYIDHWAHPGGQVLLPRIGISNYGEAGSVARVSTELSRESDASLISRFESVPTASEREVSAGAVQQIQMAELEVPLVAEPQKCNLSTCAEFEDGRVIRNRWPLWLVPEVAWGEMPSIALIDPINAIAPIVPADKRVALDTADPDAILIATRWSAEVAAWVLSGRNALFIADRYAEFPVEECPFWREAMKLFDPHPVWQHFPHEGFTDFQFYGLAPDCSYTFDTIQKYVDPVAIFPILRRVDARTFVETHYASEAVSASGGRLIITTLRPHGGLGDQPAGIRRCFSGQMLLSAFIKSLAQ